MTIPCKRSCASDWQNFDFDHDTDFANNEDRTDDFCLVCAEMGSLAKFIAISMGKMMIHQWFLVCFVGQNHAGGD